MNTREGEIAGTDAVWLEDEPRTPILYVHGVPNSGSMWAPFLERTGGIAPDLPGFGESGKSAGFDYSIGGYGDWLEAFVDHLGLERFSLVMHDWGAVGLELAQRRPDRGRGARGRAALAVARQTRARRSGGRVPEREAVNGGSAPRNRC